MSKHPFDYQRPTPAQVEDISRIRDACKALYQQILATHMHPNHQDEAIKKLEEVSMWSNKGIVFREGFSEDLCELGDFLEQLVDEQMVGRPNPPDRKRV